MVNTVAAAVVIVVAVVELSVVAESVPSRVVENSATQGGDFELALSREVT